MKINSDIKNIIFDLGGVILNIDYNLTIKEFKKLGINNFENIFSQFKQSNFSDKFEINDILFYVVLGIGTGFASIYFTKISK